MYDANASDHFCFTDSWTRDPLAEGLHTFPLLPLKTHFIFGGVLEKSSKGSVTPSQGLCLFPDLESFRDVEGFSGSKVFDAASALLASTGCSGMISREWLSLEKVLIN